MINKTYLVGQHTTTITAPDAACLEFISERRRTIRAAFERERRQKLERNVRAMADDVKTVSYRRFAARVGRSKYAPNVCQREGKR